MNQQISSEDFAAAQTGVPVKVFTKANISRVSVTILNPFGGKEQKIVTGKPKTEESAIKLWSPSEVIYFERQNAPLIKSGDIIEWRGYESKAIVPGVEASTDEELLKILTGKFMSLKTLLTKTESSSFVHRLLVMAREHEVSVKYIEAIENKLAELELTSE